MAADSALAAASADFRALLQADSLGRLAAPELVGPAPRPAAVILPASAALAPAAAPSVSASSSASLSSGSAASPASSSAVADVPYESVADEIRQLHQTVADLTESSERVMAQNIALLADLESAQKAVRELRSEKDALAVQLKKRLERA